MAEFSQMPIFKSIFLERYVYVLIKFQFKFVSSDLLGCVINWTSGDLDLWRMHAPEGLI